MDTDTRWTKVYEYRFHLKYHILQHEIDKIHVKQHTIDIANHPDPNNIGGCVSCPSGDSTKLAFSTGWAIVYEMKGLEIHFLNFYKWWPERNMTTGAPII